MAPPPVTPTGGRHRWPCERCHVLPAEITLIALGRMSLAVLGGEQSGMEGVRQRVESEEGGGRGRGWASGTVGICIPLSSVTG